MWKKSCLQITRDVRLCSTWEPAAPTCLQFMPSHQSPEHRFAANQHTGTGQESTSSIYSHYSSHWCPRLISLPTAHSSSDLFLCVEGDLPKALAGGSHCKDIQLSVHRVSLIKRQLWWMAPPSLYPPLLSVAVNTLSAAQRPALVWMQSWTQHEPFQQALDQLCHEVLYTVSFGNVLFHSQEMPRCHTTSSNTHPDESAP